MSNRRPTPAPNLCQFQFANGKRCRMTARPGRDGLCLHHATAHRRTRVREDDLSDDLVTLTGNFFTNSDISEALGRLFEALAANRLSPKRAGTLAYIAQLLLCSQPGVEREARLGRAEHKWDQLLYSIFHPRRDNPAPSSPEPSPAAPK